MKTLPVWTCVSDVQQRTDFPVFARATFTFTDDSTPPRTHSYTEERVVDPSAAAIAKLARDQVAQLQRMDALALNPVSGPVDLTPPVVVVDDPDPAVLAAQAKQAEYSADLRQRIAHKNMIDLGFLKADDQDVQDVIARLEAAVAVPDDRAVVESLFG